jgi:hypothetical protein
MTEVEDDAEAWVEIYFERDGGSIATTNII